MLLRISNLRCLSFQESIQKRGAFVLRLFRFKIRRTSKFPTIPTTKMMVFTANLILHSRDASVLLVLLVKCILAESVAIVLIQFILGRQKTLSSELYVSVFVLCEPIEWCIFLSILAQEGSDEKRNQFVR